VCCRRSPLEGVPHPTIKKKSGAGCADDAGDRDHYRSLAQLALDLAHRGQRRTRKDNAKERGQESHTGPAPLSWPAPDAVAGPGMSRTP